MLFLFQGFFVVVVVFCVEDPQCVFLHIKIFSRCNFFFFWLPLSQSDSFPSDGREQPKQKEAEGLH